MISDSVSRPIRLLMLAGLAFLAIGTPPTATTGQDEKAVPVRGWVTDATVLSVYDGDTCTVEVRKIIKVRLKDCWAPERKEPGGVESGDYLAGLVEGERVLLRLGGSADVWRTRTFGRDVGRIWLRDKDVSTLMIEAGHAFETKAELQESMK